MRICEAWSRIGRGRSSLNQKFYEKPKELTKNLADSGRAYDCRHAFIHHVPAFCLIDMEIKSILKSKLASVGLMILLALILVMSSKLFMQKREVQKEIKTLQEKADSISKDNAELSELIKYYKTDEYAQRAARDKLNLKKEGEFAVSLPPSVTSEAPDSKKEEKSNPKKWYDYFF